MLRWCRTSFYLGTFIIMIGSRKSLFPLSPTTPLTISLYHQGVCKQSSTLVRYTLGVGIQGVSWRSSRRLCTPFLKIFIIRLLNIIPSEHGRTHVHHKRERRILTQLDATCQRRMWICLLIKIRGVAIVPEILTYSSWMIHISSPDQDL